jgi:endoglucanase
MILEALSNAFGPSGCEGQVRQILIDAIKDQVDEYRVDHLGNVIALQRGTERVDKLKEFKVMVAAHMDEVGFMITHADESGMLHFVKVGGIDDRVLLAKVVRIGEKRIPGVLVSKPVHLTSPDERKKVIPADQLVIDIGANSKAEAEKLFTKGDYAVFDTCYEELGDVDAAHPDALHLVKGKAFDDRVGCAVLVEVVAQGPYPFDLYPVFTTMEEVGLRGARVAGYSVMPDAAFVIEGTICDDGPGDAARRGKDLSPTTEVGKGPAISVMDRSVIADRRLVRLVIETAEAEGIPYQFKQPGQGGTDAGAIHLAQTGVPTLPVSVPGRYIHSPVSVLSKADFENTVRLMVATLQRITPHVIAEWD